MGDKYDDLLAIRNQSAQEAALRQIYNQAQAERADYDRYIQEGDVDKAAWAQRGYQALAMEYNAMLAGMAQQQQQYTDAERDLLRDYPQIANDPVKWRTALAAANNLILRGYDRNSGEYVAAIAHACDVLNSDGTESLEVASPDEALRACQSKYGAVSVETYNEGVKRLIQEKRAGKYPMGQT